MSKEKSFYFGWEWRFRFKVNRRGNWVQYCIGFLRVSYMPGRERFLTQRAPDSPYVCLHCGAHISSDHLPWCKSLAQNGGS